MSWDDPVEEPYYKIRWVIGMPRPDPPITDRDCMPPRYSWRRRVTRQLVPRPQRRDCCWHHSVDWQEAAAVATRIARQVRREGVAGEETIQDRALDLLAAAGLPKRQHEAVFALLLTTGGIHLSFLAGQRRLSYMDGRKRTHMMLETGVRRTVVVRWREKRQ